MTNYRNQTAVQRRNDKMFKMFDNYFADQKKLPSGLLYDNFLEIAERKLNISKDEAINKYGAYTTEQWETLLKLGWNK